MDELRRGREANGASDPLVHDFQREQKWFLFLAGYSNFNKREISSYLYTGYKFCLLLFLGYMATMGWTGAFKSLGNKVDTVQALHMSAIALVSFLGLVSKLLREASLRRSMFIIRSGVYNYSEPKLDHEAEKIKVQTVRQIRSLTSMFGRLVVFVAAVNTVFVPLMQVVALRHEDTSSKPLNPYLPQPFYMPFDTRTPGGYALAYAINVLFMTCLVPLVTCMDAVYLSCTLQIGAQLRILRRSLGDIEARALLRMGAGSGASGEEFQSHLIECLKENVRHHQAVLRLKWEVEKYTGYIFLIVVCLASCVLASQLIAILEKPPIHAVINFSVTLFCEMVYTYHYCWYGEELTRESSKVFFSLYSIDWFKYSPGFRRILITFLCNTRNPIEMTTVSFKITASLHTFNSIMTTMYKIMNVVRNKN